MRAIDVHIHPPEPPGTIATTEREAMASYFGNAAIPTDPVEMYDLYERLDIRGVVFSIDSETTSGGSYVGNDYIADVARSSDGRFIGFASVDPWKGDAAVAELERSVTELGLRGLKMHPGTQAFRPDDRQHYRIWEAADGLGIPVLFHTGQTGVGAGQPGGAGIRLEYSNPVLLDGVAADFPGLTIIMAHPAVPWQEEQLSVVLHKANVYMDLSGWSPKYFRPILVTYLRNLLQDKAMFGSDYPVIAPDRWLRDFDELGLPDEVSEKILLGNAHRVLGIDW